MRERRSNADWWSAVTLGDDASRVRARFRLALAAAATGELHAAAQMLARVQSSGHAELASRAAFELTLILRQLRDDDGAQRVLAEADMLAHPATHCDVKVNVGLAWQQLGQLDRATNAYQAVLTALGAGMLGDAERTAMAVAAFRLGQLALWRNERGEAERLWRRALAAGDEDVSPHAALALGDMLNSELFPAEVEELLRVAIDYDHPDVSPRAALALARCLRDRRQIGQARDLFREVERSRHPEVAEAAAEALHELRRDAAWRQARRRHAPLVFVGPPRNPDTVDGALSARVIIVGAGTGGQYLWQSLERPRFDVVGFVDDDAERLSETGELAMLGTIAELPQLLRTFRIDEVLLAIPTAPGRLRAMVVDACRAARVPLRTLPTMHELLPNRPLLGQLRRVRVEETVGDRDGEVDRAAVTWLRGRSVLVTGAAGVIGGELVRRLAHARVKQLVMVDRDQPALRGLKEEIIDQREFRDCFPILADWGDQNRMDGIMRLYETEVVFDAAGYRDPELVETDPIEAATNGPIALSRLLRAAGQRRIERFVHVSSWHAERCSTLFGAANALSERAVTAAEQQYPETRFLSVRVGQLFRDQTDSWERQAAVGGPIQTLQKGTIARLLTGARAAELILNAARVGIGGEVLGTTAGETVDLWELARRFLELRGEEHAREVIPIRPTNLLMLCPACAAEAGAQTAPHPDHPDLISVHTAPAMTSLDELLAAVRDVTSRRDAASIEQLLRSAHLAARDPSAV